MRVYHVCGISKFKRYLATGRILKPVRAWRSIFSAEEFSQSTGRQIILCLKFPQDAKKLDGHKGGAVYLDHDYDLPKELMQK